MVQSDHSVVVPNQGVLRLGQSVVEWSQDVLQLGQSVVGLNPAVRQSEQSVVQLNQGMVQPEQNVVTTLWPVGDEVFMAGILKGIFGQRMNEGEYDRIVDDTISMKVPMIVLV